MLLRLQQSVYKLAARPDGFDIVKEISFRLSPTFAARQGRIPNSGFPLATAHCLFRLFPTFALGQVHAQQNQRAAGDDPQRDLLPEQPYPQKRRHHRLQVREGCHT